MIQRSDGADAIDEADAAAAFAIVYAHAMPRHAPPPLMLIALCFHYFDTRRAFMCHITPCLHYLFTYYAIIIITRLLRARC